MAHRLPPLKALRAFEAGARHLSFTRAAEELFVTQAAISHQVKVLEEHLGVRLFRRLTRRLLLTEAGQTLLPVVSEAFERVAAAAEAVREDRGNQPLTVSLTPTFGVKWMSKRLGRFWRRHRDIDLRLQHSHELVDFARDDVDMAVRWGRGDWPGIESEFLLRAAMTPVCSPVLLEGRHPLRTPADLRHHTLLHAISYDEWTQWLRAAGAGDVDPRRGPVIDDASVATQATLDGEGVSLGLMSMVADDLASGRLVRPFDIEFAADYAYYVVYPPDALNRASVRAFRDFLLAEAAADAG